MKNGKNLSKNQKITVAATGRDPNHYKCVKNLPDEMLLLNTLTGMTETVTKK